ncbi:hypothetical protein ACIPMU_35625 [Streptomyces cyaneofuscatus]|uniref:hypothetical protein n=1 Tax=Streptomyces cyaneofuscatus TaxID=66883 RepID=UPI0037FDF981
MQMTPIWRARAAYTFASLLVVGGATVAIAPQASAGGDGNKVHNCFGRWYNTDWDQRCSGSGANYAGTYDSEAKCSLEPDNLESHWRAKGSKAAYNGHDCDWSVTGVQTWFYQ